MKIVVNCKIVEEVLGPFLGGFLVPFLGSIFDPFLDFSWTRICLFYGTFSFARRIFGPFLDLFWDVHLAVLLNFLGPGLLNRLHVSRGRAWRVRRLWVIDDLLLVWVGPVLGT
jgi:hypothetical protein